MSENKVFPLKMRTKTIIKMYRKGYEAEQISDILDMEVEKVREIIENE